MGKGYVSQHAMNRGVSQHAVGGGGVSDSKLWGYVSQHAMGKGYVSQHAMNRGVSQHAVGGGVCLTLSCGGMFPSMQWGRGVCLWVQGSVHPPGQTPPWADTP